MRHLEMSIYLVINLASILAFAWATHQVAPHWSADRVLIWSLIVFVAAWRAASDARKER